MKKKLTLAIILIFICLIVLLPSITLLGLSSWQIDDYYQASLYRNDGLLAFWQRLYWWSPRPLSDSILYIYYGIVGYTRKPFVGIFLAILWMVFGVSLYISLKNIIQSTTCYLDQDIKVINYNYKKIENSNIFYYKIVIPLLLSLLLFIYFLFVEKPSEIFYWPAGAAPYLLSASGIILTTSTLIKISNSKHISYFETFSLVTFTILTAFSSEVGAVYSLLLSLCLLTIIVSCCIKYIPVNWPILTWKQSNTMKLAIASSISFALSSTVLFFLKTSRVGKAELNSLASPITGNIKSSFILATERIINETFFSYSFACKLALLLLVILLGIQAKVSLKKSTEFTCLILIVPLLATNFVMINAAYYQFGELCCDRHLHFRAILTGLSLFLLGLMVASRLYAHSTPADSNSTAHPNKKSSSQFFLLTSNFSLITITCLTLILLVSLQISSIVNDFKNFQSISHVYRENWHTNLSSQSSSGEYVNHHPTDYVMSFALEPGIYSLSQENLSWHIRAYMMYFKKEKLSVK